MKCAGAPLGTLLLVRMVECGGCGKLKSSAVFVGGWIIKDIECKILSSSKKKKLSPSTTGRGKME